MLSQARYNDKVLAYGWKSVERNAWHLNSKLHNKTYD
jgi:hypothetical protein